MPCHNSIAEKTDWSPLALFPILLPFIYFHDLSKFHRRLKIWQAFYRNRSSPALKNALATSTRRTKTPRHAFIFFKPILAKRLVSSAMLPAMHHRKGSPSNRRLLLHAKDRGMSGSFWNEQAFSEFFLFVFLICLRNEGTHGHTLLPFESTADAAAWPLGWPCNVFFLPRAAPTTLFSGAAWLDAAAPYFDTDTATTFVKSRH